MCLERPVDVPGLLGGTATEGTVFPTMTDIDGSAPDTAPETSEPDRATESDAELTARFERDANDSQPGRRRGLASGNHGEGLRRVPLIPRGDQSEGVAVPDSDQYLYQ